MTSEATAIEICAVCKEEIEPHLRAECMTCAKPFHLQQRTDLPGKDCGDVWINEEHLGLDFCCFSCIEAAEAEPEEPVGLDDVLDLGEAAESLGWPEDALERMAEAGRVKHRRTGGGILLFLRRDLLALTKDLGS